MHSTCVIHLRHHVEKWKVGAGAPSRIWIRVAVSAVAITASSGGSKVQDLGTTMISTRLLHRLINNNIYIINYLCMGRSTWSLGFINVDFWKHDIGSDPYNIYDSFFVLNMTYLQVLIDTMHDVCVPKYEVCKPCRRSSICHTDSEDWSYVQTDTQIWYALTVKDIFKNVNDIKYILIKQAILANLAIVWKIKLGFWNSLM